MTSICVCSLLFTITADTCTRVCIKRNTHTYIHIHERAHTHKHTHKQNTHTHFYTRTHVQVASFSSSARPLHKDNTPPPTASPGSSSRRSDTNSNAATTYPWTVLKRLFCISFPIRRVRHRGEVRSRFDSTFSLFLSFQQC